MGQKKLSNLEFWNWLFDLVSKIFLMKLKSERTSKARPTTLQVCQDYMDQNVVVAVASAALVGVLSF